MSHPKRADQTWLQWDAEHRDPNSQYYEGGQTHPDFTGADGNRYIWDEQENRYVLAPGAPVATPDQGATIPETTQYPVPMAAATELLGEAGYPGGAGPTAAGDVLAPLYQTLEEVGIATPRGRAAVEASYQRVLSGDYTAADVQALKAAGSQVVAASLSHSRPCQRARPPTPYMRRTARARRTLRCTAPGSAGRTPTGTAVPSG